MSREAVPRHARKRAATRGRASASLIYAKAAAVRALVVANAVMFPNVFKAEVAAARIQKGRWAGLRRPARLLCARGVFEPSFLGATDVERFGKGDRGSKARAR